MDIARLSMAMSKNSLSNAVQLSLMKLQMNTDKDLATGMNDMINTMAVDPNKGVNLDTMA